MAIMRCWLAAHADEQQSCIDSIPAICRQRQSHGDMKLSKCSSAMTGEVDLIWLSHELPGGLLCLYMPPTPAVQTLSVPDRL